MENPRSCMDGLMPTQKVLRVIVCWFLVPALLSQGTSFAARNQTIEEMRAVVSKIGTGKKARAIVRMRDATMLNGYIRESTNEGFTVVAKQKTETVAYTDVAKVKKKTMHPAVTVVIVVVVMLGIGVIVTAARGGPH